MVKREESIETLTYNKRLLKWPKNKIEEGSDIELTVPGRDWNDYLKFKMVRIFNQYIYFLGITLNIPSLRADIGRFDIARTG